MLCNCTDKQAPGQIRTRPNTHAISVCELLKNIQQYRNTIVDVTGIYWNGLRQSCPEPFVTGGHAWPSAVDLVEAGYVSMGGGQTPSFETDRKSWDALQLLVLREARARRREEVWVRIRGEVRAPARYVRDGGEIFGGYGHLGGFPAELVVERVLDVNIRPNPTFDYSELLGPHL